MNSIFRKTLIASAISLIFSTAAFAADDLQDTIDGTVTDEQSIINKQPSSDGDAAVKNNNYGESAKDKEPCKDDMGAAGQSQNYDQENHGSENRPMTDHQKNVTEEQMDATGHSQTHDQENHGSENRPMTDHQKKVTEEEEEEEEVMPPVSDDSEMNIQIDETPYSDGAQQSATTFYDSNLYSMSADELIGMNVLGSDDDSVGHVSSIVLSPDQRNVHAVITVGSLLGIGGRDVLVPLQSLTQVNDDLRIDANKQEVEAMNDYGSENFVALEGDAAISTAVRTQ